MWWIIILFPGVVTVAVIDWILPYNFDYGQKVMFSIVFCIIYFFISLILTASDSRREDFDGLVNGLGLYVGISIIMMFILALLYFGFKVEVIGELFNYIES